jgi:hypothetical protein
LQVKRYVLSPCIGPSGFGKVEISGTAKIVGHGVFFRE